MERWKKFDLIEEDEVLDNEQVKPVPDLARNNSDPQDIKGKKEIEKWEPEMRVSSTLYVPSFGILARKDTEKERFLVTRKKAENKKKDMFDVL